MKYKLHISAELEYEIPGGVRDPQFFFEEHFCATNILRELRERAEEHGCACGLVNVKYVGEAAS